jgi:FkbM family methyltransferase
VSDPGRLVVAALSAAARLLPARLLTAATRVPAIGRLATHMTRGGTRIVEVTAGPLRGTRMLLDLSCEKEYWAGTYERETQRLLAEVALEGQFAWDVGAHIGFVSLLLARRCDRVLAVEPSARSVARLRTNVALNDAPVEVVAAAVAAASGVVAFADSGDRLSRLAGGDEPSVPVQAVTLDELVGRFGAPDFVKIDVEGAEADILTGAATFLASGPTLLIEVHSARKRERVLPLLEAYGYVVMEPAPARLLATS